MEVLALPPLVINKLVCVETSHLPDGAAPGYLCDRASRLYGDRSAAAAAAAGSRPAPSLRHGSSFADTPTAASAWPDPSRDPRPCTAAAAWRHVKSARQTLKTPTQ